MGETIRLPDLQRRNDEHPASGWFVLTAPENVSVPSLDDARRCSAITGTVEDPCKPRIVAFDPPHRTVIVDRGPASLRVTVRVTPGLADTEVPVLHVTNSLLGVDTSIVGTVIGDCRDELRFEWPIGSGVVDAEYVMFVEGYDETTSHVILGAGLAELLSADPCALTLTASYRAVGIAVEDRPADFPRPPLLAVDGGGCVVEAWAVNSLGWVLVPNGENEVQLRQRCSGGVIGSVRLSSAIRDAMFWGDTIAVLTSSEVRLFDWQGCAIGAEPFASGFDRAVGLGISANGFLVVVQVGTVPTGGRQGNIHVLRRDGTEVRAALTFEGRGYYARLRNAAFAFDAVSCGYKIEPTQISAACCATAARSMPDEESLFFRLIDDLRDLRRRAAFPTSGRVVIGPAQYEDPLDAGRPGTQWHRILMFGEIPEGCAVGIETRAFDELIAGDPLLVTGGWSQSVLASANSAVPVRPPGDVRVAAADAMVLAKSGRFLWLRITLHSNGTASPRITSIELERPRLGIARFLPQVFQNSTAEDDFLRRWLAIFENTVFDGVAQRFDEYAALFDPRTAPREMLPFLAYWLSVLEIARLSEDEAAFRRALIAADELARTRGSVDGIILAARLYMGVSIQIVESFKRRSGFVLGSGGVVGDVVGPILGCQTTLCGAKSAAWLGEEPMLGCSFLLDCDAACDVAFQFDVLVAARDICTTADLELLRFIIQTERPAHTSFRIRPMNSAGLVVGPASIIGQQVGVTFNRDELDPATFGVALLNGPSRPRPIDRGFSLGFDSRLAAGDGLPGFHVGATVGHSTRVAD